MAIKWLDVVSYNRQGSASRGQQRSVTIHTHAQYLTGQREASVGEHAAHVIRERVQERPRSDLVATGHRAMPGWVKDPLAYWKAADTHAPRVNTHLAKELLLTLPRELTHDENQRLIQQALQLVPTHHPLTWAFHCPKARNGRDDQPHVHILISPKINTGIEQDAKTFFLPERQGGAANQMLWTTPRALRALHRDWEALLRATLKEKGLEYTLARPEHFKELRLTWQEMDALQKFLHKAQPGSWGQEHTISSRQIAAWRDQEKITIRQATWIAQRSQKQLTYQIEQLRPVVRESTEQLTQAQPWNVLAKYQARTTQRQTEATIQALTRQRYQTAQVYQQWLSPALAKAKAQWRQEQARERAQRRSQHRGSRAAGLTERHGRALEVQIEPLDEQLKRQLDARARDRMERT